jgi:drug/metabolite transporter (DMT)-like permease
MVSVLLALLALLGWGTGDVFGGVVARRVGGYTAALWLLRVPVRRVGWFWPAYLPTVVALPALYLLIRARGLPVALPREGGLWLSAALNGLCLYGGSFAYNAAVAHGETALVAPVAGAYPALFVLLAVRVFRDPLRGAQLAGIGLTLLGIVLLAIVSA